MSSELLSVLNEDFLKKTEKNPQYSLRSYAKWLGINPTSLSLFLNGKRGLALSAKKRIALKLDLPVETLAQILNKDSPSSHLFNEIALDKIHLISDWFYFAVLSLMETKEFQDSPKWIARRLNITQRQATSALVKLEKLGMAIRDKAGILRASGKSFQAPDHISSVIMRRTHYQALELARASLDHVPLELRDFSAMTMAIDPAKLPHAKKRIKFFRRRLCSQLESGKKKEVYRLCIQLFPLSSGDMQ